jgi:hypothetical protein
MFLKLKSVRLRTQSIGRGICVEWRGKGRGFSRISLVSAPIMTLPMLHSHLCDSDSVAK